MSPSNRRTALMKSIKTIDVAPSSYYKVSQSTEKAKRRQTSLGVRTSSQRRELESAVSRLQ